MKDAATGVEIRFGIGTSHVDGRNAIAVVVNDLVAPLTDIAGRHKPPLALPVSTRELLLEWDKWHDWLRALDLKPSKDDGWQPIDAIKFKAPVLEPWNIFQTFHNFERASIVSGRMDLPKSERILPDIFFGSRSALAGYGDTVYRECAEGQFDFEVEVTAVIGRTAYRVPADNALDYVAGYAIANDFTMHHAWWRPIRNKSPINDIIRMKNFPGYTPMSRVIVPRDLVGDTKDLLVKTWVDGQLRQDTRTTQMLWSMGELIEYLSWIIPLQPGDLILSGSPLELPLPPEKKKGVQVGQKVVCEVQHLGRLENLIGVHTERQPHQPA